MCLMYSLLQSPQATVTGRFLSMYLFLFYVTDFEECYEHTVLLCVSFLQIIVRIKKNRLRMVDNA